MPPNDAYQKSLDIKDPKPKSRPGNQRPRLTKIGLENHNFGEKVRKLKYSRNYYLKTFVSGIRETVSSCR